MSRPPSPKPKVNRRVGMFHWFWLFLSFGNGPIESTQKAWRVVNQKNAQLYPRRYKGINPIIIPDKKVRFEKGSE